MAQCRPGSRPPGWSLDTSCRAGESAGHEHSSRLEGGGGPAAVDVGGNDSVGHPFVGEEGNLWGWVVSAGATAVAGLALWLRTPRKIDLNRRTSLVVVGLGWLCLVTVGSLPFILTGVAPHVVGAFFESVSGFTTTGATISPVIEDLPRSILLWRSISHWIGGMGIIVLGVAILPFIGVGGAQLFHAEAPGISTDRLTPRIASTARLLWGVYAALTGSLFLTYVFLGMSPFDAVNHAMSALATGGFSTRTASLGAFSPAIQWVTTLFMLIAGTNFALHYRDDHGAGQGVVWGRGVEGVRRCSPGGCPGVLHRADRV